MNPSSRYPLFSKDDLSAFWALFGDNLANIIIVIGVCKFLFHMPDEIVFGRILPGIGVALLVGLTYYVYLAKDLARREGRNDVTALPYGISTPVMFVYLFGIIGPVYFHTKDAHLAWQVGLGAAFLGGIIEGLGSLVGPWLKKVTPRAGMLGTLAGIALVWIATVPLAEIFEHPIIGFPALIIIFLGLVAGFQLPLKLPAGLVAIGVGTIIAFALGEAKISVEGIGFYVPVPVVGDLISGIGALFSLPTLLMVIIPLEIYNFIETMNNVESAEAAGDKYPVRKCQIMDGVGTMVGAFFGSPFPTTVYIGHPGYKRLRARCGYALGVALVFFFGATFGLIAFLQGFIPIAAVAPMLVYVGLIITAQAFTSTPRKHAMAVAMALIPHVSDIIVTKWNSLLSALKSLPVSGLPDGLSDSTLIAQMLNQGAHVVGQSALSNGSIITGLLWGAATASMIDGRFRAAAGFPFAAAVLTGLGIIHSSQISLHFGSPLFIGYLIIALFLSGLSFRPMIKQMDFEL